MVEIHFHLTPTRSQSSSSSQSTVAKIENWKGLHIYKDNASSHFPTTTTTTTAKWFSKEIEPTRTIEPEPGVLIVGP